MKKLILSLALSTFCFATVTAQALKVRTDGNVVAFSSGFTEDTGDNTVKMSIKSNRDYGIKTLRSGSLSSTWSYASWNSNPPLGGIFNVGLYASSNETTEKTGRAFGIIGAASNSTSGYNYGVMGILYGNQYGAAVYGDIGNTGGYVGGRYAGYFNGDIRVIGTVNGVTITTSSDLRYKQNIVELAGKAGTTTLKNILNLNPVQYNLQQVYLKSAAADTATVEVKLFDEKSQLFQKKHYGLIAQDLQKIYPDLVYEDGNGYLSVDYIGLIPLLIESVKELQSQIDALKGGGKLILSDAEELRSVTGGAAVQKNEQSAALYQNIPNPFSSETQIRYYLPASVTTAYLCVYNLQGKQLKQYKIAQRGESVQQILGSEFSAGIYLYSLIADGNVVDTKRMTLTE